MRVQELIEYLSSQPSGMFVIIGNPDDIDQMNPKVHNDGYNVVIS